MTNKDFNQRMEELDTASQALTKIEEVTAKLLSAAEAIAELKALK